MHAVEVDQLTFSYGERTALRGVTFSVNVGEIFALLGPNGGGKTTLFRILSTALRPSSGSARIADLDVVRQADEVRQKIGVTFQSPSLDRALTVVENLTHHGHLYGLRGSLLQQRIQELLNRFHLSDRGTERVAKLSGGLQRRVEIAKALLHQPTVLLLDEPSTGLDPGARRDSWEMLRAAGATTLLTTHILEEAEGADRLAILDRGTLVALGTPEELRREIGGSMIRVSTRHPEKLRDAIRARFGLTPEILNGSLRFEHPEAHRFSSQLAEAFTGEIESITVGRPTLEDLFIRKTGRTFE